MSRLIGIDKQYFLQDRIKNIQKFVNDNDLQYMVSSSCFDFAYDLYNDHEYLDEIIHKPYYDNMLYDIVDVLCNNSQIAIAEDLVDQFEHVIQSRLYATRS